MNCNDAWYITHKVKTRNTFNKESLTSTEHAYYPEYTVLNTLFKKNSLGTQQY